VMKAGAGVVLPQACRSFATKAEAWRILDPRDEGTGGTRKRFQPKGH
jgi:hypothetical protein